MDYKKYNLYRAFIQTGNPAHNNRPVLLLEDDNNYKVFDIYNITHDDTNDNKSNKDKNINYKYNYPVKKWKEAGLKSPSLIKIREILNIEKRLLFEKIGELQKEDIEGLEDLVVKMYEDDKRALEKYNSKTENRIEIPEEIKKQLKFAESQTEDQSEEPPKQQP